MKLTLPDKSFRELPEGSSGYDLAKDIGPGLAKSAVAMTINGVQKDLNTHYTVDTGNQNVNFKTDSVPTATDVICISTIVDNQYRNNGNNMVNLAIIGLGYDTLFVFIIPPR